VRITATREGHERFSARPCRGGNRSRDPGRLALMGPIAASRFRRPCAGRVCSRAALSGAVRNSFPSAAGRDHRQRISHLVQQRWRRTHLGGIRNSFMFAGSSGVARRTRNGRVLYRTSSSPRVPSGSGGRVRELDEPSQVRAVVLGVRHRVAFDRAGAHSSIGRSGVDPDLLLRAATYFERRLIRLPAGARLGRRLTPGLVAVAVVRIRTSAIAASESLDLSQPVGAMACRWRAVAPTAPRSGGAVGRTIPPPGAMAHRAHGRVNRGGSSCRTS
jgi:hypothetical protein